MFEKFKRCIKKHYCRRCNSDEYISILQDDLIEYVTNNDTNSITKIPEEILNLKISLSKYNPNRQQYNKPILLIACHELAERVLPQTVETLINQGADVNYFNTKDDNKETLHYAVSALKPLLLEVLIKQIDPSRINALADGDTPLNLLIKQVESETSDFKQCLKQLLAVNCVNVNTPDDKYITPILHAAEKKFQHTVNKLLEKAGIDLDNHFLENGKNARALIEENNLFEGTLPGSVDPGLDVLFRYVKFGEIEALADFPNLDLHVNYSDEEGTLLQYACKKQHRSVVEFLIEKNCQIDETTPKNSELPIQIAGRTRNVSILRLLAEKHIRNSKPISGRVLASLFMTLNDDIIKLISEVLSNANFIERSSINAKNKMGNTSLHYSTKYGSDDLTIRLLELGASLTIENDLGFRPIDYIRPQVLEQYFDNCIKIKQESVVKTTYEFNYSVLLPIKELEEIISGTKQSSHEEMPLLEAEACTTRKKAKLITESEVVYTISNRPELRYLLVHPLIASFMELNWKRKWSLFFWPNLMLYAFFCFCLSYYIIQGSPEGFVLLVVGLLLLLIREMFQIMMSWRLYLKSKENWLELLLILLCLCLYFPRCSSWNRALPQLVILLATGEVMLLIGQHPQLATYLAVLLKVLKNFFKYLLLYCVILLAFAFSFWKHFGASNLSTKSNGQNESINQTDSHKLFSSFPLSLNKILVTLSGELEASSFLEDSDVIGQIMLAALVFTVTIVLANLLSALAIVDVQEILNESEINGYRERLKHVIYMEKILAGRKFARRLNENIEESLKVEQKGKELTKISESVLQRAISLTEKRNEETKRNSLSDMLAMQREIENRKDMQDFRSIIRGLVEEVKEVKISITTLKNKVDELKAKASN